MVNVIVNEILTQLAVVPFADRMAGIVKAARVSDANGNVKIFPVELNTEVDTCNDSELMVLVPDSKKTSIIYFEDRGTSVRGLNGEAIEMTANFTLVCWFNYKLINPAMTNTSLIAGNLIKYIPLGNMGNIYPLMGVFLELIGQEQNDGGVFAKYSYKEEISQYLTYPYDYVALNLRAEFRVRPDCIEDIVIDPALCL